MGLNITHTMTSFQFENRENLQNTAKDILNRKGASKETIQTIVEKSVFDSNGQHYPNAQLAIIKASSQIGMNEKLKETLKYLRNSSKKSAKTPVLGELWNMFSNDESEKDTDYDEIEVDYSLNNIFAAA